MEQELNNIKTTAETLTPIDLKQWQTNIITFLIPLITMYLSVTIGIVSAKAPLFSFGDLIPNAYLLGAMTLYFLNALLDLSKKYLAKNP